MILSVSRRTDIPAFYSPWFFNRLKEGFVLVPNPMNPRQISQVSLEPSLIDGIVFWTKNPEPIIKYLPKVKVIPYYFQFTLTPYGKALEGLLPNKEKLIETFKTLSDLIGPHRVLWRYDPIIISPYYGVDKHIELFEKLASALKGYTHQCTFSFVDIYGKIKKPMAKLNLSSPLYEEKKELIKSFSAIAKENALALFTCCEDIDAKEYGIFPGKCIDGDLLANIGDTPLKNKKDSNQRKGCCCHESIDIGVYNTCSHGCVYCYANHSNSRRENLIKAYNPKEAMLCTALTQEDRITIRKTTSLKVNFVQTSFKDW